MGDVAVHEHPIDWVIEPPSLVRPGQIFTAVARIEGRADPQVYEAYIPNTPDGKDSRYLGHAVDAGPGFNNYGTAGTYVWFNIRIPELGKYEVKFRLTWKSGSHYLYGGLETFVVYVRHTSLPLLYNTDDQDLLALLEPRYYDPTPIELMNERA